MPTVLWRPITPSRQALLDMDRVVEEFSDSLEQIKAALIDDFRGTVASWDTEVDFAGRKYILTDELRVIVYPTGEGAQIWTYVNEGTRPHLIAAKGRKPLRFQTGYRAKTRPGSAASGAGGASGSWRSARQVHHPGTTGRHFEKPIAQKNQAAFRRLAENALRRAVRA